MYVLCTTRYIVSIGQAKLHIRERARQAMDQSDLKSEIRTFLILLLNGCFCILAIFLYE